RLFFFTTEMTLGSMRARGPLKTSITLGLPAESRRITEEIDAKASRLGVSQRPVRDIVAVRGPLGQFAGLGAGQAHPAQAVALGPADPSFAEGNGGVGRFHPGSVGRHDQLLGFSCSA